MPLTRPDSAIMQSMPRFIIKANATAEEVEEAAKALKQDIVNWKSSEATRTNP